MSFQRRISLVQLLNPSKTVFIVVSIFMFARRLSFYVEQRDCLCSPFALHHAISVCTAASVAGLMRDIGLGPTRSSIETVGYIDLALASQRQETVMMNGPKSPFRCVSVW